MKIKEIKITPPEGYIIDESNSTFNCIKFKKKELTYEDIAKALFTEKKRYYIGVVGNIHRSVGDDIFDGNNATSQKQLEKLLAINKLMNVAKYLNGDWKPNWNNPNEVKYYINLNNHNALNTACVMISSGAIVHFKDIDTAREAIKILGEDTIRLALSTDW